MNRFHVTLPALMAWVALCLPWQVCESDCRTAVVGGWGHDCHLPGAHGGCCQHDEADPDRDCRSPGHDDGSHSRLVIPMGQPEPAPELGPGPADGDPAAPPGPCGFVAAVPGGLPRRIVARCAGPPGAPAGSLRKLRSVVLLL